jgi:hypothetical protein
LGAFKSTIKLAEKPLEILKPSFSSQSLYALYDASQIFCFDLDCVAKQNT